MSEQAAAAQPVVEPKEVQATPAKAPAAAPAAEVDADVGAKSPKPSREIKRGGDDSDEDLVPNLSLCCQ